MAASRRRGKLAQPRDLGQEKRVGNLIREKIPQEEVIPQVKRPLEYYRDNAKRRERMARFIDRIGIEEVKEALC